jgi:hypothetical protein
MIKKYFAMAYVLLILFPALSWGADKVQGNACYSYGDNESLVQAEQMTKTLAIRNAIESYSIFIQSTTQVTDLQLSSDLINTISTGQVKQLKILKRLQSGRKLCYTLEGYVEPNDLKTAIREYLSGKDKIDTGRVKGNEWIRILDAQVLLQSPKGYFQIESTDAVKLKNHKDKRLSVEIEFLKPCTASTLFREIYEQYKKESDKVIDDLFKYPNLKGSELSSRSAAFFQIQLVQMALHEGKDAQGMYKEYQVFCEKNGIDPIELTRDLYIPQFRCDNKIKVFVTFLSAGNELETVGIIPVAQLINDKFDDKKTLMVSGERTSVFFSIPDKADSWDVWVPK